MGVHLSLSGVSYPPVGMTKVSVSMFLKRGGPLAGAGAAALVRPAARSSRPHRWRGRTDPAVGEALAGVVEGKRKG